VLGMPDIRPILTPKCSAKFLNNSARVPREKVKNPGLDKKEIKD
jgi:hypothetical protein